MTKAIQTHSTTAEAQAVYPSTIAKRVFAIFILIAPFLLTSSARRNLRFSLQEQLLQIAFSLSPSLSFCFSLFSDRSREPIVEDTDERDLRAVGLNLRSSSFGFGCLLTQPPRRDRFSFTLCHSVSLCL